MQFGSRPRVPVFRKPKSPAPLSVGRHAFVDRAPSISRKLGAVTLTDKSYTQTLQTLADGQEVEILGWRQHPSVRYNVRCVSDGEEGWVAAECLRASRDRVQVTLPVESMKAARVADEDRRQAPSGAAGKKAPALTARSRK